MAKHIPINRLGIDGVRLSAISLRQRAARGPVALMRRSIGMKKIAIAAVAAAGLLTLGACGQKNEASTNLESAADNLDAAADNATTDNGQAIIQNEADNLHAAADNAADADKNGSTDNPATAANVAAGNAVGK
ncbi:hypothetical protein [uncultured Sphingomonas sp.]|uniref:hypothetical protein n=1 Tax=uncultured Sphingomonas sp. TaxID=158754 RepID=UPI0035CA6410